MKKIASTVVLLLLCICYSHGQTLSVTLSATNYNGYQISCFGEKNGSLTATITGGTAPYAIEWSTGETTATIIELAAGYYIVRVSDSFGAEALAEITLTEPEPLQIGEMIPFVYPNGYNVSAFGSCNGSVATTINGGTPPYTYEWVPGQQTILLPTNLCANENLLKVIDANGCGADKGLGLSEPERDDWQMTGNVNTNPATQFMGTTDNKDFSIRTYNQERLRVMGNGDVKINGLAGTSTRVLTTDANGKIIAGSTIIAPVVACADPFLFAWQLKTNVSPTPNVAYTCWNEVGIGTDDPQKNLGVKGGARFFNFNNHSKYLDVEHDGANASINSTDNILINYYSGKDIAMNTGTTKGNVETGGNTFLATGTGKKLGIGTTTVGTYLVEVAGELNATGLRIDGTPINLFTQWLAGTNAGDLHYDGGNVGIGIDAPMAKLDVAGDARVQGHDFEFGWNDSRATNNTIGKAFVHDDVLNGADVDDQLRINYQGSFEGGVHINGGSNGGITLDPGSHGIKLKNFGNEGYLKADANGFLTTVPFSGVNFWQQSTVNTDDIFRGIGNVGIGEANPTEKLVIEGHGLLLKEQGTSLLFRAKNPGPEIGSSNGTITFWRGDGIDYNTIVSGPHVITDTHDSYTTTTLTHGNSYYRTITKGSAVIFLDSDNNESEENFIISSNDNYFSSTAKTIFRVGKSGMEYFDEFNDVQFKVTNAGKAYARSMKVTLNAFSDFVFNKDYELMPLNELGDFIKTNKHLPGVPTEKQVIKDGLDLGEFSAKLLEKVEELTLHLIELNKKTEVMSEENAALSKELQKLKKQLK